jgi:NOL1/NOP2/fmu family ribosome biogenesis protein
MLLVVPLFDFNDVLLGNLQECRAKEYIRGIKVRMETNAKVGDVKLTLQNYLIIQCA